MPMVSRETTNVVLRPIRSPKCPNTKEPSGRAMNAMANVSRLASSATVWLEESPKKTFGK